MKRSLEVLREKLASSGWSKEAGRVSTLIKWAESMPESGKTYSVLDGALTVKYNVAGGATIEVVHSNDPKYTKGSKYQQGAGGDEGKTFDVLFSLIKKSSKTNP